MIAVLPESERPRERCLRYGANALSLRECLALLIGSGPRGLGCLGVAKEILERPGAGLPETEQERVFFNALENQGDGWLAETSGLGEANRARLLAAFELARRYARFSLSRLAVQGERFSEKGLLFQKAFDRVPSTMKHDCNEWLGFVPCYAADGVGEFCVVEWGVRTHVNSDAREFFARLLPLRPSGVFLFHNHPSGHLRPSLEDIQLTRSLSSMCASFGIELLGHAIVSAVGHCWVVEGETKERSRGRA